MSVYKAIKLMYLREAQLKMSQTSPMSAHAHPRPKSPDFEFVETEIQSTPVKESRQQEAAADNEDELIKKAKIQVQRLMSSFNALIQHQRAKQAAVSYEELDFKKKHATFNKSIKAYVDVCCNIPNLVDEAYRVVESLSTPYEKPPQEQAANNKPLNNWEYISDVEIFNRVMFEVAKTGKVSRLYVLFRKMRSNKDRPITPNLNSYAAVLQAFGYQVENKDLVEVDQSEIINKDEQSIVGSSETNESKQLAIIRLGVERVLWDITKANVSHYFFGFFLIYKKYVRSN